MRNREIKTNFLTFRMGHEEKTLVNSGVWFMYQIDSNKKSKGKFLLETNQSTYLIGKHGNVVEKVSSSNLFNRIARIYFAGIPYPMQLPSIPKDDIL
ncbi:hypothetical protein [Sphaerochaeta sp.]|uniref:hypothetical protein n=1 Tax=Sphaerochaeta sp. TaxID=1972642 RepID=UPI002FCC4369